MSARRSAREISDPIARRAVAEAMAQARGRRARLDETVSPTDVIEAGMKLAADLCARYLASGETGLAHAHARVHAHLLASQQRLFARDDARNRRKLADLGIVRGMTVRVLHHRTLPAGTLLGLHEDPDGIHFYGVDDDGGRHYVYYRDVEVVPLCHDDIAARCSCRPDVSATQEELLRLPAGSLIEDRHGVTWQLLASSGTFAGLWSCDGAALPAPIGDIWDDIAPVVLARVGDAPAGGAR